MAQGDPFTMAMDELPALLEGPTYLCGELGADARQLLKRVENARLATPSRNLRRPGFLAEMGWEQIRAGKSGDPSRLTPVYLETQSTGA
jgi:hypothetical protein